MNIIVAADKNWGIGRNNELLVSIPADMKMFREETTGKVVVMGRKTLESFPNGLPLKNRTNIVITGNRDYQVKGAVVVHSIEEALKEVEKYLEKNAEKRRSADSCFVIYLIKKRNIHKETVFCLMMFRF